MNSSAHDSDPSRHLHVSLLDMTAMSHNNYGLWAHPENQKRRFREIAFWKELAREAESAKLDAIFFADVLGIASGLGDSPEIALREGLHVPELDPAIVVATMLDATEHLGFGVTLSTTYDPPFSTARKLATLDHLSGGRVGWNIVMSYLPNANENYGQHYTGLSSADRYDRAEEFLEVCYKLWEASWEEDAVVADTVGQVYIDPSKVHRIDHVGPYFSSSGPSLVDPSPQRTPVIFQAGMSDRGREFAAAHAEVAFVVNRNDAGAKRGIQDLRAKVAANGRARDEMRILPQMNIIAGTDDEEALAKLAGFQELTKADGYLAHEFGRGFNPLTHPRSQRLDDALEQDGLARADSGTYGHGPDATIGDVIDAAADLTNERFFVVGGPETVADQLETWAEEFDLDGFLMRNYVHPGTVRDFGRHVVPELQRRGRYRTEYEGSTLRESVFGAGRTRIADSHPAARHRPGGSAR
jgi:FMN-dependent oxidoreductase (nitrilotriacetate monooxygenase family)